MSDTVAESVASIKLSDPKPARCAACLRSSGPDVRFVNFNDAFFDGGTVVDRATSAVIDSIDELHLCDACVKTGAEALGFKPQLHATHLREIKRLETLVDHWKGTAERLNRELNTQLGANLG